MDESNDAKRGRVRPSRDFRKVEVGIGGGDSRAGIRAFRDDEPREGIVRRRRGNATVGSSRVIRRRARDVRPRGNALDERSNARRGALGDSFRGDVSLATPRRRRTRRRRTVLRRVASDVETVVDGTSRRALAPRGHATRRAHPPRRRTGVKSRLGIRSLTGTVPVAGARARSQTPPRREFSRRRLARGRRRRRRRKREVLDGARERRRDEKVLGPVRVLGLGRERERRSGFERARPNTRARGFVFDVERTRRRIRPFARVAARVARKPIRKPSAASRSQRGV